MRYLCACFTPPAPFALPTVEACPERQNSPPARPRRKTARRQAKWFKLAPMSSEDKTPEQKIRRYTERMRDIRAGNPVDETAYYGALEDLLNAVGTELKPKVLANFGLKQEGHGLPDFGLYTAEQIKRGKKSADSAHREKPERGAGEVKGLAADIGELARSAQVGKYLDGYGLVLATNYRQFALVERDKNGNPVILESRQLAESEDKFWRELHCIPKERGAAVCEFLRRAMTRNAPISKAEDVANLLASYAREAAVILESRDASALAPLREALESSLGTQFQGEDGDHFFRSTLVQTVFYGLFSAWMESDDDKKFDWKSAGFAVKTPVIRTLFAEIVNPRRIDDLGIRPLLDSAAAGLNRVENKSTLFSVMGAFAAIQHFYEPFLAAFDPELRKQLGVWYTPPEIVRYMVRRVDSVLKTELNLPDGLADDRVRVLDPCGGTGAYLVETLRVIGETLEKRGDGKALAAHGMCRAAKERVFGFEILPASFVVAHWQIGALLAKENAPLNDGDRAAVYLTNSLTGWEKDPQIKIAFPELADERTAAGKVKREEKILVIIGNPPYNAYAGTAPEEEGDLVAPYKEGLREEWEIKKYNLDDLFVRFFRIAENRIVKTGRGVVCYISNSAYATEPSFVVMRKNLLQNFSRVWIDNMNGDSRATGKKTPDGHPDPSVFSTNMNKAGIQVGTAVGLFVRKSDDPSAAEVHYRDFWGKEKRDELEASLESGKPEYQAPSPAKHNRLSFRPMQVREDYLRWPLLSGLFGKYYDGMDECRGGALSDFHREPLEKRMRDYFNPRIEWAAYQTMGGGLSRDAAGFDAQATRQKALEVGFNPDNIVRHARHPMDPDFCYYSDISRLWNRHRPELRQQAKGENMFLLSRKGGAVSPEGSPMFWSRAIVDRGLLRGLAQHFPIRLWGEEMGEQKSLPNLSALGAGYLRGLGCSDLDSGMEDLFYHALAMGYSPEYRLENADGLRIDWPRIPLPRTRSALEKSAALGRRVAGLLDSDVRVEGLDSGAVLEIYRKLGVLCGGKSGVNMRVSAGWGHRDGKGKVFPGSGLVAFRSWDEEELSSDVDGDALGRAVDVYLNGEEGNGTRWSGVPERAWHYRIGGYQVLKKWLSYRQESVLGRDLRDEEALHFTGMVRRLSGLVLSGPKLDANYRAVRDDSAEWGEVIK